MQELEKFKKEINIAEFSAMFGYQKDAKKSTRNSLVMKLDSDEIVISRDRKDSHYIYFNRNDDRDNGSIIDFLQRRQRSRRNPNKFVSLGEVRKILRAYLANPVKQGLDILPSSAFGRDMSKLWERLPIDNDKLPYTNFRGIDSDTLKFFGAKENRIRYDAKEKALFFALSDMDGYCGIEKRTETEKRIIKDSKKGLFVVGELKTAQRIVVTESPIDAMSHKALNKSREGDFFISTMGSIGEDSKTLIRAIMNAKKDIPVVIATDNDKGGEQIANKIAELAPQRVVREKPTRKDWNEDLIAIAAPKKSPKKKTQSMGMQR